LKPLSNHNLCELNDSLLYSKPVRDTAIFYSFSQITNGLVKAIYGLGHCAQDLLYFIPTPKNIESRNVIFNVYRQENSTSSRKSHISITIDGTTYDYPMPIDDKFYISHMHLKSVSTHHTAMDYSSYKTYIHESFGVDFNTELCQVLHSVTAEAQHTAVTGIDDAKNLPEHKTNVKRVIGMVSTIQSRKHVLDNNKNIIDSIIGLVKIHMISDPLKDQKSLSLLAGYVYTSICMHIKNADRFEHSTSLDCLDLKVKITFDKFDSKFSIAENVDKGRFMPISTLH